MLIDLLLREVEELPTFTVLQVGAYSTNGSDKSEPFFHFPDWFRGSRVIVCDPDAALCDHMNQKRTMQEGVEYFAVALGEADGTCNFHLTEEKAWCSPYRPDELMIRRYQNMNAALPVSVVKVDTKSLDQFLKDNEIDQVDYIKVNLPWAGLPLLQGGDKLLKQLLGIKVETALVPLYEQQALFGELGKHLTDVGLTFDRFDKLYGRTFNPIVLNKDINYAAHHLWADSLFLRDITQIKELSSSQLLKLAIISDQYGGQDITLFCLMEYDVRHQTTFGKRYGHMDGLDG